MLLLLCCAASAAAPDAGGATDRVASSTDDFLALPKPPSTTPPAGSTGLVAPAAAAGPRYRPGSRVWCCGGGGGGPPEEGTVGMVVSAIAGPGGQAVYKVGVCWLRVSCCFVQVLLSMRCVGSCCELRGSSHALTESCGATCLFACRWRWRTGCWSCQTASWRPAQARGRGCCLCQALGRRRCQPASLLSTWRPGERQGLRETEGDRGTDCLPGQPCHCWPAQRMCVRI